MWPPPLPTHYPPPVAAAQGSTHTVPTYYQLRVPQRWRWQQKGKSNGQESNLRPAELQSAALPSELPVLVEVLLPPALPPPCACVCEQATRGLALLPRTLQLTSAPFWVVYVFIIPFLLFRCMFLEFIWFWCDDGGLSCAAINRACVRETLASTACLIPPTLLSTVLPGFLPNY